MRSQRPSARGFASRSHSLRAERSGAERRADRAGHAAGGGAGRELRRTRRRISRDRRARRTSATRPTTRSPSAPITSSRPSTREWRSSRRRGSASTRPGVRSMDPVETNNVFKGFGGPCEMRNNGDAVVRYDQLANRWLIVMPIFARGPARPDQPPVVGAGATRHTSVRQVVPDQPGAAVALYQPPAPAAPPAAPPPPAPAQRRPARRRGQTPLAAAGAVFDVLRRQSSAPIRLARITATSSSARCSPTTRVRRSGPTATTCRPAPATT